MDLFSSDFPAWFYIPNGPTRWNFSSGLYLMEPSDLPVFENSLVFIPYKFYSSRELFSIRQVKFFKITRYIPGFQFQEKKSFPEFFMRPVIDVDEYIRKVLFLKEQIKSGNIYEVNFCMEFFSGSVELHPGSYYMLLYKKILAPFSMLIRMGTGVYFCFSPELFLERKGRTLRTRPVKGTLGKRVGEKDPTRALEGLKGSLKERAENAMAVDVARNDFSRVASRKSVRVPELFRVDVLENIYQMYSTVECEVREGVNWEQIWESTFPMASMTGAPKPSAMQYIHQTESFERGFYSGSIGLFRNEEDAVMNVIIRSPEYDMIKKSFRFCVGSAITWLSDPEKEWEECRIKVQSIFPGTLSNGMNAGLS